MGTLANSEDPDEMQHYAAFHQGLHYLLRLKQPSGTKTPGNLENSTCDPFKYTMGSPMYLYQCVWKNPPEYKWFMWMKDSVDPEQLASDEAS